MSEQVDSRSERAKSRLFLVVRDSICLFLSRAGNDYFRRAAGVIALKGFPASVSGDAQKNGIREKYPRESSLGCNHSKSRNRKLGATSWPISD